MSAPAEIGAVVRPESDTDGDTERSPLLHSIPERPRSKRRHRSRKTSIIAIVLLTLLTLIGAVCGFILPQMAQSYVEEALDYTVDSVALEEVIANGARVRVTGDIYLNPAKASNQKGRRVADLLLSMAGAIHLTQSTLDIELLYDGSSQIAGTSMDDLFLQLAHGKKNSFDMSIPVRLYNVEVIGRFVQEILQGSIEIVPVKATVSARVTKIFSIQRTAIRRLDYKLPGSMSTLPSFNITRFGVNDVPGSGVAADASVDIAFNPPISALIPSVVLDAAIKGCDGKLITLASGYNMPFQLDEKSSIVSIEGHGVCDGIPEAALTPCDSNTNQSPVDMAMQTFLAGNETTIYLSGARTGHDSWIQDVLRAITIPIQLPGSQNQQFARDIVLSDVKFNLPSFFGGGGKPKISGRVRGTIDVPSEINVAVKVDSVHVLADLLYKGKKFAYVESPGWAPATSRTPKKEELVVEVVLKDAPVTITNDDVFSSVVSNLLGGNVLVDVVGTGDVKVVTGLGKVEAHSLPIEAKDIEIGGLGFIQGLQPKIKNLAVLSTSDTHMELSAEAELNNPTNYQVDAGYIDALLTYHARTIGNITVENLHMTSGENKLMARLRYAPSLFEDAEQNIVAGSELLGQYLSELPVNVTLAAHAGSIPDYPNLSRALAHLPLQIAVPVPRIIPAESDDDDDDHDGDDKDNNDAARKSQFLVSAKFHVFSSTASFVLRNPLNESVTIETLHAVATYHGDVVGNLDYEYPIVLSGTESTTETTRLPVTWKLPPSDILRKAVSGTLRVNATARAKVAVGRMSGIPIEVTLREVGAGVGI